MKPSINNSLLYPGLIGLLAGAAAGTTGIGAASLFCLIACPIRYFSKSQHTQKVRKIGLTAIVTGSAFFTSGIAGVIGSDGFNQYTDPARAEAKRINTLNVENCLMKKEDTVYCDRVAPKLTSKDLMKQVEDRKAITIKDLEVQKGVAECLSNSLIGVCKEVDASVIDLETQNAIAAKIQEITVKKCVKDQAMHYCKQIDLSSADKVTEESVLKTIETIEEKQKEALAIQKAEALRKIIAAVESSDLTKSNQAIQELKRELARNSQPAQEYMSDLRSRTLSNNSTGKDIDLVVRMANGGVEQAREILEQWRKNKKAKVKTSRKSKQAALREICEAGAEYSRDGYGTQAQIAHELAYWVIDLYKQTGGAASEGQLRTAGSHGYMYENCSKY